MISSNSINVYEVYNGDIVRVLISSGSRNARQYFIRLHSTEAPPVSSRICKRDLWGPEREEQLGPYRGTKQEKKPYGYIAGDERNCEQCDKEFTVKNSVHKFCQYKCRMKSKEMALKSQLEDMKVVEKVFNRNNIN